MVVSGAPATGDRDAQVLIFGGFTLNLGRNTLHLNDQPVAIRPRELDLLVYLAQRPNRFISKAELTDGVWRGEPVSDANLRVQMSGLRRVLANGAGRRQIVDAVPNRGYRFCLFASPPAPVPTAGQTAPRRHNLPVRVKKIFGRDHDCGRLMALLSQNRLATIVGTGGIGKTTLALTVAERLVDAFDDGVRLVDLAGLADPELVAGTLAATIGVALGPHAKEDALIAMLARQQILFVLDNCEHLIGRVASLVESILTQTRHIRFLCTSREALRIDGEGLLRLGPLELPPQDAGLVPDSVAKYAAIRLFNDRASQGGNDFHPDDAQVFAVAGLCRQLDGNPLAIELAAARLGLFGLDGLIAQLDENLGLMIQGRRTAVPRHRTLRETIDWSYSLLPPAERRLLDHLSVFQSHFSLDAAKAVTGQDFSGDDLFHSIAELVTKSLVSVDSASASSQYRLLLLTREFAREKLAGSGHLDTIARRHAIYFLDLLTLARRHGGADAEPWVADVGSAINWSLGDPGDPEIACNLIRASFNVMARYSRLPDQRRLIERALNRIDDTPGTETLWKLGIYTPLLNNIQFTSADQAELMHWIHITDDLAERLCHRTDDFIARCERLMIQCFSAFTRSDAPDMLRRASEGIANASGAEESPAHQLFFERALFQAHHFGGRHDMATLQAVKVRACLDKMMARGCLQATDHVSPAITTRIFEARTLWLQGKPVAASEVAGEVLETSLGYAPNITCYVLGFATIPIALWRGDHIAPNAIRQMQTLAANQGLGYWSAWADMYAFILETRSGSPGGDPPIALPPTLIRNAHHADHLSTLCLSDHKEAIERVEAGLVGWNAPEVLRRQAEWDLACTGSTAEAEARLRRAVDLARQQNALGWELRATASLAQLWQGQGRTADALHALRAITARFETSLPDHDLVMARTLTAELEMVCE